MKEIINDENKPGKGTGNNVIIISLIGLGIPLYSCTSYTFLTNTFLIGIGVRGQ